MVAAPVAVTADTSTLNNQSEMDDVPPTESELSRQEITKEAENKGQRLVLEVIEAIALPPGTLIKILPSGVLGGERRKQDGRCCFGSRAGGNDYSFLDSEGCGSRHFAIQYSVAKNAYYIRDMKEGNGTFVRLDRPYVLAQASKTS